MSNKGLKRLIIASLSVAVLLVGSAFNVVSSYAQEEEKAANEVVLKISGMTCGGCEKKVQAALEACAGVTGAKVSHKEGQAVVTGSDEVNVEELTKAVEKAGFKVQG